MRGQSYSWLICAVAVAATLITATVRASEVDPYTYGFVRLQDASPAVNERLNHFVISTMTEVNRQLLAERRAPAELSDVELEFRFFREFQERYIDDVAYGQFEKCVATNNCDGWPPVERIQMRPQESIFAAADWRYIPSNFYIASVLQVCGVRIGTDKLTHFFDDAFRYFNAVRDRRNDYDLASVERLSQAFERSYMGARITGVVSHADVAANVAGVHFYRDIFSGEEPVLRRDERGLLVFTRAVEVCDYVGENFDERVLPNDYVFSGLDSRYSDERRAALLEAIGERRRISTYIASELPPELRRRLETMVLERKYPEPSWQNDLPRYRLAMHAIKFIALFMVEPEFREAALLFRGNAYDPDHLDDRAPVEIKRWRAAGSPAGQAPATETSACRSEPCSRTAAARDVSG